MVRHQRCAQDHDNRTREPARQLLRCLPGDQRTRTSSRRRCPRGHGTRTVAASNLVDIFVITLDLFLNLEPFCRRTTSEWGKNQDVRWIVDISRMKLVSGERSQLYGYPEFSSEAILADLETVFYGQPLSGSDAMYGFGKTLSWYAVTPSSTCGSTCSRDVSLHWTS